MEKTWKELRAEYAANDGKMTATEMAVIPQCSIWLAGLEQKVEDLSNGKRTAEDLFSVAKNAAEKCIRNSLEDVTNIWKLNKAEADALDAKAKDAILKAVEYELIRDELDEYFG